MRKPCSGKVGSKSEKIISGSNISMSPKSNINIRKIFD